MRAGTVPALGAWAYLIIDVTLLKANVSLFEVQQKFASDPADIFIHGVIALNQGFIVSSMVLAATMVYVIDRQFHKAAAWMAVAAVLSMVGVIHAYDLTAEGLHNRFGLWAAPPYAVAYWATAVLMFIMHWTGLSRKGTSPT